MEKAIRLQIFLFQRHFIWKVWCFKHGRGSFDWKLEVLVPFLRIKRDMKATRPPHALFSSNASNQNFEIAVLVKIVQKSDKNSEVNKIPLSPEARVENYTPWVY
jgi:hypothetical protein